MNPFGVDNVVETLKMQSIRLLVLCMVGIVVDVEAHYVAVSKLVIEDPHYKRAILSTCEHLRCILMKPTHFLVTKLNPISKGLV